MKDIKRILFATDLSDTAGNVGVHAEAMARAHDAELHLLHVKVLLEDAYNFGSALDFEEFAADQQKAAESRLEQQTGALSHVTQRVVLRDAFPADAIVSYAAENDIDLIIMGTHAREGLSRLFLGSVAAEVSRETEASVMVVGIDHDIDPDGYKTVLVAVDFSSSSLNALRRARKLAHQFDSKLIVMHAVDDSLQPPYYPEIVDAEAREMAEQALRDMLDATADRLEPTTMVKIGNPHHCLVEAAKEHNAQLIVMGTLGLRGIRRVLLGSVTERVMRDAPCAVYACREPAQDVD